MIEYNNLNWETLNFVRQHLYPRLSELLGETTRLLTGDEGNRAQNQADARRQLDMAMNIVSAWELLVRWKTEGNEATTAAFQEVNLTELPEWLLTLLGERAILKMEQSKSIWVHPETFYEGLFLLVNIAEKVGVLSHIMLNDASSPREGVWLRIVFVPAVAGGFQSKVAILDKLNQDASANRDTVIQFAAVNDFLEINRTRFSLQNNTRTGHQAFAVLLPISTTESSSTISHGDVGDTRPTPSLPLAAPASITNVALPANTSSPTTQITIAAAEEPASTLERVRSLLATASSTLGFEETVDQEKIEKVEDVLAALHHTLQAEGEADLLTAMKAILDKVPETLNLKALQEKAVAELSDAENALMSVHHLLQENHHAPPAVKLQTETTLLPAQVESSAPIGSNTNTDVIREGETGDTIDADTPQQATRLTGS